MEIILTFISTVIVAILAFIGQLLVHKRAMKKLQLEKDEMSNEKEKLQIHLDKFSKLMNLTFLSDISISVHELFEVNGSDRFKIFVAINGTSEFNYVTEIFTQRTKDGSLDYTPTYENIKIDRWYKDMLTEIERYGTKHIDVLEMDECMLKDFYEQEGVHSSLITHLLRNKIDEDNDYLVYCSLAKTEGEAQFKKKDITIAESVYNGKIIPDLKKIID